MRVLSVVLFGLLGCTASKDDTGVDGSDDTGGEDTAVTESSPVITGIGLTSCAPNTDGVDMWSVSVNVIDPEDDVAGVGSTVTVLDGETELAVYDLACASGTCTGGWSAAWDGIDCTTGEASVFRFVVVDEFGHQSAPYDYTPV